MPNFLIRAGRHEYLSTWDRITLLWQLFTTLNGCGVKMAAASYDEDDPYMRERFNPKKPAGHSHFPGAPPSLACYNVQRCRQPQRILRDKHLEETSLMLSPCCLLDLRAQVGSSWSIGNKTLFSGRQTLSKHLFLSFYATSQHVRLIGGREPGPSPISYPWTMFPKRPTSNFRDTRKASCG